MNRGRAGEIAFAVLVTASIAFALLAPEGLPTRPACRASNPPVFRSAQPTAVPSDANTLVRAVSGLGRTPPLTEVDAWRVPAAVWLGTGRDLFRFYEDRMTPVRFDEMPAGMRSLLGLPPTGSVDSPPLLFVDEGSAALLRPDFQGNVTVLVMRCSATG